MKRKNILICLDRLGIGGVETFVYNQALALKDKGCNVIILSNDGIFREKLENHGIEWIEFDFKTKNYFDYEKIKQILEILRKYKITEVHVNQLPAINYIWPACLMENVPYIAYLHFSIGTIQDNDINVYNYFENNYSIYKESIKQFFKYAYKIIAITPEVKNYTMDRYGIENTEKCVVRPNSINFDEYKSNKEINRIENIILVSRLDSEKKLSIINAIMLYETIKRYKKDVKLSIVGSGSIEKEIKEYIKAKNISDVTFTGETNNVKEYVEQADLVIGLGRCIIEAIAMKRLAVISNYDYMGDVVIKENIDTEINNNFCGKLLGPNDIEELAKKIILLKECDIRNIVNENYNIILKKLNIYENIVMSEEEEYKYNINQRELIKYFLIVNNQIGVELEEEKDKVKKIWKDHIEYKEWIEKELDTLKSNISKEECIQEESKKTNIIRKINGKLFR